MSLAAIAAVAHVGLMWSPYGAVLRGVGGNARAVERAGWSIMRARVTMYALAGVTGALAGLALLLTFTFLLQSRIHQGWERRIAELAGALR